MRKRQGANERLLTQIIVEKEELKKRLATLTVPKTLVSTTAMTHRGISQVSDSRVYSSGLQSINMSTPLQSTPPNAIALLDEDFSCHHDSHYESRYRGYMPTGQPVD
ncbi:hypothetical protein TIFTF001_032197 [Ficus carica]|uniref:Uncharacterized protein n=1 Tax=Ficus carica TaxID=3494 RepID=A0AA88DWK9_FICCA|nr:hypothetical protein TIFTF001_032197 [Ficus carica]